MSTFKLSSVTTLVILPSSTMAHSDPLLFESFESGDMSATNAQGFS